MHTMKRHNIHFSDQQTRKLRELSEKTDIPVAEHVRRAIDNYLSQEAVMLPCVCDEFVPYPGAIVTGRTWYCPVHGQVGTEQQP